MKTFTPLRLLTSLAVAGTLAGGAYAFTAANTVPATTVGSGSGTVSGYTVTNIHYTLDATTPSNIDSVTFSVSPAIPSTGSGKVEVQAALSTGGPDNFTCTTDTGGSNVTCATTSPQLTATTLSTLSVIAAQ
jgi:hypothetical protein